MEQPIASEDYRENLAVNNDPISATDRALANPLIFSNIFALIAADKNVWHFAGPVLPVFEAGRTYTKAERSRVREDACRYRTSMQWGRDRVLYDCALVNRRWFHEAIPYLWRKPGSRLFSGLTDAFEALETVERRQLYANHVEKAREWSHTQSRYSPSRLNDKLHEEIVFPKLKSLKFFLESEHIQKVRAPNIEELILDPRCECYPTQYWIKHDEMNKLLDRVATLFPNVKKIVFEDTAWAYPGVMERFAARMPRLETFDYSMVRITNEMEYDDR